MKFILDHNGCEAVTHVTAELDAVIIPNFSFLIPNCQNGGGNS